MRTVGAALLCSERQATNEREIAMAELIVVGFKRDIYRASEALNMLQDMNSGWVVDLSDAVAVYRDSKGKLRVDQSYQMTTGEGAAWGGLFGVTGWTACALRIVAADASETPI
jgi:uncharacterized membrane protein